jgi:serine protease Do
MQGGRVLREQNKTKLLARVLFVGILASFNVLYAQQKPRSSAIDQLEQLNRSVQGIVSRVAPAIVRIDVVGYGRSDDDDDKEKSEAHLISKVKSLASGIILDADGYLLTNAHVLKGAKQVRVTLVQSVHSSNESAASKPHKITFDARIVGVFDDADVAVLKIEATGLPVLPLGDASQIQQGQLVFAIGNPEGLNNSVSMGVVSAVGRPPQSGAVPLYIQTDAALNPGSSGGALVDIHGHLIGMASFSLTESGGSEGLGFALPSNIMYLIYKELKSKGHVQVGDIGLNVQSITPTMVSGLRLPQDSGLIVSDVAADSPAEAVGIQQKDILISLDGSPIDTVAQYATVFYTKQPGDQVELQLLRGSQLVTASARVRVRVDDPEHLLERLDLHKSIVKPLGIVGTALSKSRRATGEALRSKSGVLVSGELAHSDIDTGLLVGDLIRSVNGTDVQTVEGLRSLIQAFKPGDAVVLQVERHGRFMYLPFEID